MKKQNLTKNRQYNIQRGTLKWPMRIDKAQAENLSNEI